MGDLVAGDWEEFVVGIERILYWDLVAGDREDLVVGIGRIL